MSTMFIPLRFHLIYLAFAPVTAQLTAIISCPHIKSDINLIMQKFSIFSSNVMKLFFFFEENMLITKLTDTW